MTRGEALLAFTLMFNQNGYLVKTEYLIKMSLHVKLHSIQTNFSSKIPSFTNPVICLLMEMPS